MVLKKFIRNGSFWMGLLGIILSGSLFLWGQLSIDLQIHDSYYVIRYSALLTPVILSHFFSCLVYSLLNHLGRKLPAWLPVTHILICYITTCFGHYFFWGNTLAIGGSANRYFSFTRYDPSWIKFLLFNEAAFLVFQILFLFISAIKLIRN